MKQRVTDEQLSELSDEQKKRLRDWWLGSNPGLSDLYVVLVEYDDLTRYEGPFVNSGHRDFLKDYYTGEALPLLSIGQMMQLIRDYKAFHIHLTSLMWAENVCDVLWYEVKKCLTHGHWGDYEE